jgi:hypothetical protein
MTKGVKAISVLPEKFTLEYVKGEPFIKLASAAKLAKIHPVILEMGQNLLKNPQQAGIFILGNAELKRKVNDIEREFVRGLRKILLIFGGNKRMKVSSYLSEDRLHFWYTIPAERIKR